MLTNRQNVHLSICCVFTHVTQFEKTDLMATRCCFELRAKTRDQPINYRFLDNNTTKNYYPLPTFCSS